MSSNEFLPKAVRDFFKEKEVIVIGGAGFVGQQLVRLLLLADASVLVMDNFSRGDTRLAGAVYKRVDVGDSGHASYFMMGDKFQRADVIFNLAATVAGVLHNQKNHLRMYSSNMRVLAGPVQLAQDMGVPVYLQTSSVCIYAPEHNSPSVETLGMEGVPHPANAGYAEAKRDGERMVQWSSNIGRAVIARPSNVAGPGDYFDELAHVIPAFVKRAFNHSGTFVLYGDPHVTREFVHPRDVASGMMCVAAFGEDKEAYNIGCNGHTTITMKALAEKILHQANVTAGLYGFVVKQPELKIDTSVGGGDAKRWSDASKLNALGWEAKIGLDTIVEQCVDDYLLHRSKWEN